MARIQAFVNGPGAKEYNRLYNKMACITDHFPGAIRPEKQTIEVLVIKPEPSVAVAMKWLC
jgi:hypothetical protein